mgnify:CR=1 FL=1
MKKKHMKSQVYNLAISFITAFSTWEKLDDN